MAVLREIELLSRAFRDLVLSRWRNDDILAHACINLPAPIFDHVVTELAHETQNLNAPALARGAESFEFGAVKFRRVDGVYWSVSVRDGAVLNAPPRPISAG